MQILKNNQKDWVGAEKAAIKIKKNIIQKQTDVEEGGKNP